MGKREAAQDNTTDTLSKKTKTAITEDTNIDHGIFSCKNPLKRCITGRNTNVFPAYEPILPPAPEPAPPVRSPSKSKKKELTDEKKKMFHYLAAKATSETITTDDLKDFTVNDLKQVLRLNDRAMTGNRSTVCRNVLDCIQNGCPPRCPICFGGRLRFVPWESGGWYYCPGFMDDVDFINCDFVGNNNTVTRVPWISP